MRICIGMGGECEVFMSHVVSEGDMRLMTSADMRLLT